MLLSSRSSTIDPQTGPLQALYQSLSRHAPDAESRRAGADLLRRQLIRAADRGPELPPAEQLADWVDRQHREAGQAYQEYLRRRQRGGPREGFQSRAQALHYLQVIAPTKLVDGAWLYGLLDHWRDPRLDPLIRTYLEELGDGAPEQNHVLLYRRLLADAVGGEVEPGPPLADDCYLQGTLQLAMAWNAERFLPEIIGYNLGYEQLPLHLLITARELNELGIDPYYFTLHITADNGDTGHARRAQQAVLEMLPDIDPEPFYRRVASGFALNTVGPNAADLAGRFDGDQELRRILHRKARLGQYLHGDHSRIGGRTVNQWLADPTLLDDFLLALQRHGWLRRGRPAEESRLWRLIRGPRAEMSGVFTPYEEQVLQDWIEGPAAVGPERHRPGRACRRPPRDGERLPGHGDFQRERTLLEERLTSPGPDDQPMAALIEQMGPARHHRPAGLLATRLFRRDYSL